jgi:hypothetical protein
MDITKNKFNINIKNFNIYTVLSILFILGGLLFWIYWGTRYNVWYDIGIYSITIVLVLSGIIGLILSLMDRSEEKEY